MTRFDNVRKTADAIGHMKTAARLLRTCLSHVLMAAALMGSAAVVVLAQSTTATLSGTVVDATGAVLPGATVVAVHTATAAQRQVQTDARGNFIITALSPGDYVLNSTLTGFRPSELRGISLNVDDRIAVRVEMTVSNVGESVTVSSESRRISTSSAVGTVIDRKFVENLPLNGRSFQALLELTPGVTLMPARATEGGQFSVNGQRATANYFTVDGVGANAGMTVTTSGSLGAAASGQTPALTVLGGTNGLVSVDALEEFRLQTSSYAAEFGRTPGGQISLVTRSGTNTFQGSAFESFRDDALDATDWFTNRSGSPNPELRQHNFGGVLGGPILQNRTFAFASYEGLRLLMPTTAQTSVPTVATRRAATAALQPYLDALPLPNGPEVGNGYAQFVAVFSDPARLDSTSVRLDHHLTPTLKLFGRVAYAPSWNKSRIYSYNSINNAAITTKSVTAGGTWVVSNRLVHDLRFNMSGSDTETFATVDSFGGAVAPSAQLIPSGIDPDRGNLLFSLNASARWVMGRYTDYAQRQINIVDSLTWVRQSHEFKFGVDYRLISPTIHGNRGSLETLQFQPDGLISGRSQAYTFSAYTADERSARYHNLSLYAQDHWKATSRLTLSLGARWEYVPPPQTASGPEPLMLDHLDNPYYGGLVGTAPSGAGLWKTRYNNFAPRLGATYLVSRDGARSLLLKSAVGSFHDLGYGQVANAFDRTYPFLVSRSSPNVPFPLSPELLIPPQAGADSPASVWLMDPNLSLPYTLQWNTSAEYGMGSHQTLTVGYVGASGRRLLSVDRYMVRLADWPAATRNTTVYVSRNIGRSNYHSLQLQLQRRLHRGLQAVASYTLANSRDTDSSDANLTIPGDKLAPDLSYGYSSFDVRQTFTGAVTYQVGEPFGPRVLKALLRDWGIDGMIRMRSAFPMNVVATVPFGPDFATVRADVVPGQPFWLDDPNAPGGRRLNRQAFNAPAVPETQGTLPRGAIRGFNAKQVDLSLRRVLPVVDRVRLQLRLEVFNVLNTPNFADPSNTNVALASFGTASQMLGRGLGGQSPLYQVGGPRSVQLSTKVMF